MPGSVDGRRRVRAGDGSGSGPRSLQEGRRRRAARTPPRCDSAVQRRRGRSADGVTGGEHGAKMDVTRCTYTPRNPYQGPREAGERADLLLPGLGGKGHQATRLGLDQHGWQYRLPPAGYSSHAAGPCNDKRSTAIGAAGVNGHGRTVVTHTGPPVGLTRGIPKLATLVPDLSPTQCTPCAPSRWILAASTQPRAPGETRADLGVKWCPQGAPSLPEDRSPTTSYRPAMNWPVNGESTQVRRAPNS